MNPTPKLNEAQLNGLHLSITKPREIARTPDFIGGRCWYPDLLKFSTGELMLNYSLNADANENPFNAQAVHISTDGGRTWDFTYDVNGFHNAGGEPRISLPDGRIVGTSTFLKPDPTNPNRRFFAHRWTYDNGGKRYAVEPWGATVEGLPRDVKSRPVPSRVWWSRINWFSDIVILDDGNWLSTISMQFTGDDRETTVAVLSENEGRHWRYLSTIADADAVPDATEGFDEPCLIRLKDGDLMCISRIGTGPWGPKQDPEIAKQQSLARAYSSDGGRTWSEVDRLPAFCKAPQIIRLQNETFVLVTGGPGNFIWFSTDARAKDWQCFSLDTYHNSATDKRFHIRTDINADVTTSYMGLVEVDPNRFFLVYDRVPYGHYEAVPKDANNDRSQIFLIEVQVEHR